MDKILLEEKKIFFKRTLSDLFKQLENLNTDKFESGDEIDQCMQEERLAKVMRLRKRTLNYISKVQYSLSQMNDGVYGSCNDCGVHIEETRLKARPTATMCIGCKEEQEKTENSTSKVLHLHHYKKDWEKASSDNP